MEADGEKTELVELPVRDNLSSNSAMRALIASISNEDWLLTTPGVVVDELESILGAPMNVELLLCGCMGVTCTGAGLLSDTSLS